MTTQSETRKNGRFDAAGATALTAAVAGDIAFNYWANALPLGGATTGEISDRYPTLVTPAGYTFSVWGVIFLGLTLLAAYQALPGRPEEPTLRRLRWPVALSCAASVAWLLLWHLGHPGAAFFFLPALAASVGVAFVGLQTAAAPTTRVERLLVAPTLGVYFGWATAATIVGAAASLVSRGWTTAAVGGDASRVTAVALIAVAAGLGAGIGGSVRWRVRSGALAYGLTVAWALLGVTAAQSRGGDPFVGGSAAIAAAALAFHLLRDARLRRRQVSEAAAAAPAGASTPTSSPAP